MISLLAAALGRRARTAPLRCFQKNMEVTLRRVIYIFCLHLPCTLLLKSSTNARGESGVHEYRASSTFIFKKRTVRSPFAFFPRVSYILYEHHRRIYDPSLSLGGYTKVHTKEQGYMGSLLRGWKVRRRATHLGLQGDSRQGGLF